MSFRELRSFCEIMRTIGYPRLISMEGFRTPNFAQVAAILSWMLERYDHTAEIPTGIDTEEERVQYLKASAQVVLVKARIKLNTKKLYCADIHAVKELLKLARLLYDATRQDDPSVAASSSASGTSTSDEISPVPESFNPAQEVKAVKQLTSELTTGGATIHGLVDGELTAQDLRSKAMRDFDNEQLEKAVHVKIRAVTEDTQTLQEQLENLTSDEQSLKGKIEKKKVELERVKTRLKGLKGLRPAFMDEYEKLEQELQQLYSVYLEKFRNLDYLEYELEQLSKVDDSKDQRRRRVLSIYTSAVNKAEKMELKNGLGAGEEGEAEDEAGDDAELMQEQQPKSGPGEPPAGEEDSGEVEQEGEDYAPAPEPRRAGRSTPGPNRNRGGGGYDDQDRAAKPKMVKRVQGSVEAGMESDDSVSPVVSDDEGAELQPEDDEIDRANRAAAAAAAATVTTGGAGGGMGDSAGDVSGGGGDQGVSQSGEEANTGSMGDDAGTTAPAEGGKQVQWEKKDDYF